MIRGLVLRKWLPLLALELLSGCAWFIGLENPTRAEASGGSTGDAEGGAQAEGGIASGALGGAATAAGGAEGSGGVTLAAACGSKTGVCGSDMVLAPRLDGGCVCIDRFEVSKDGNAAVSVAGAEVWNYISMSDSQAACQAVNKRLCRGDEWRGACSYGGTWRYPYGNDHDPSTCVTWDNGKPTRAKPTGSDPDCESASPGLFDLVGNVAEWTLEDGAVQGSVRGGSYASQDTPDCDRVQESYAADTQMPHIGFRCCAEPTLD